MTRDVLIRISGNHVTEGDQDNVEMITAGDYFFKNGKHYIVYDEVMEDTPGIIKNRIKLSAQQMEIKKSGAGSVRMVFEPDKSRYSSFITPAGEMMIGIRTSHIRLLAEEDLLKVRVVYSLEINYEHLAECEIVMAVCSRAKADLKLSEDIKSDTEERRYDEKSHMDAAYKESGF